MPLAQEVLESLVGLSDQGALKADAPRFARVEKLANERVVQLRLPVLNERK